MYFVISVALPFCFYLVRSFCIDVRRYVLHPYVSGSLFRYLCLPFVRSSVSSSFIDLVRPFVLSFLRS